MKQKDVRFNLKFLRKEAAEDAKEKKQKKLKEYYKDLISFYFLVPCVGDSCQLGILLPI